VQASHEFQLFQAELRHFVTNLHHYVMTRVIYSVWTEHKSKLESAANVDDLCAAHAAYIEANLARCLLKHKKGTANRVLQFIRAMLGLVLDFTSVYRVYLDSMGIKAERRALPDDVSRENPADSDTESEDELQMPSPRGGAKEQSAASVAEAQRAEQIAQMGDIRDRFKQQHRLLMLLLQRKVEKGRYPHLEDLLVRLNYNGYY